MGKFGGRAESAASVSLWCVKSDEVDGESGESSDTDKEIEDKKEFLTWNLGSEQWVELA